MNMISSTSAPYLLHVECSGKEKQTFGNRFRDILEKEKAENKMFVSAAEIAVNEMDRVRKEETVKNSSDNEAENSHEKREDDDNKI